jgi:tetratricopeptide (TPR) repeat protein
MVRWPYDKRVENVHGWSMIAAGIAIAAIIVPVFTTSNAGRAHSLWWWPTQWMGIPAALVVTGTILLTVPLHRSTPKITPRETIASLISAADGTIPGDGIENPAGHVALVGEGRQTGIAGASAAVSSAVRPQDAEKTQIVIGDIPREPVEFERRSKVLDELLHPPSGHHMAVVFTITGPRGVGKSQLAAACARDRVNAGWRVVAWLDAETREQLLAGFGQVALEMGLADSADDSAQSAARVKHWLEADGNLCLLVLDNAVNPDQIRPLLPAAGNAEVIITSSRQAISTLGVPVNVDVFSREQAITYLSRRTGLADELGAERVADELGYLPLALAQAASIITGQRLGYATYLERLATIPATDYLVRGMDDPYPRGAADTILLAVEVAEHNDTDGLRRRLLEVACLLSPAGIPRTLLRAAVRATDIAVDEALQELADWSLLTWSIDGSAVIVHRLIMRLVRERAHSDGSLGIAADQAMAALRSMQPPDQDVWQHTSLVQQLVQQIMALADNVGPSTEDDKTATDLLLLQGWAGWYLVQRKDFSRAIPLLQQVVTARTKLLGEDNEATMTARSNLAGGYLAAGRTRQAISLYKQILSTAERLYGADNKNALTSRGNLALAYLEAERLEEALPLLEQAAAESERLLGREHERTLIARNNLATAYAHADRLDEAIPMHRQNLADRRRILGPDHPYTLTASNNLANAYLRAGQIDEAITLYEQNLVDRSRILGPDHAETLQSRNNLANAYARAGRLDEAIPIHEQAFADRQRILGPYHPETLGSLNNLAHAYEGAGRVSDAIRLVGDWLPKGLRALVIIHGRSKKGDPPKSHSSNGKNEDGDNPIQSDSLTVRFT